MRRLIILVALAVAFAASTIEAAKPTSKPTSKPTVKTQAPKGGTTKSTAPKASVSKVKTTKTGGSLAKGGSAKTTKAPASTKLAKSSTGTAKADTKSAKAKTTTSGEKSKKQTTALASTSTSTSGTTSTGGSTKTIDFTATDVGQKLQKNGSLRSKIEAKLLAAGYTGTVYEAAYGFKNMGQLNAATNMVQNQGYDFNLLKLLMTGKYVDPKTHTVYVGQQMPDGSVKLVKSDLATNPISTYSLGQAKQQIAGGAEMPDLPTSTKTTTTTTKTQQ